MVSASHESPVIRQLRPEISNKCGTVTSHLATSDWLYLSISRAFSSNTKNFCSVGLDRYASHKMSHLLDLANEKAGPFFADQSEVSGEL